MNVPQKRDANLPIPRKSKSKIVLLGGGPASLSCATFLGRLGYTNITIYEKEKKLGGLR